MLESEDVLENILGPQTKEKQSIHTCSDCCEKTPHWIKSDGEVCMKCGTRRL